MKKNIVKRVVYILLLTPSLSYAQGLRGKFNQVLTDYIVPAFLIFMVIGVLAGIIRNWDLIEDKNNDGTRIKGWSNVGMLVGYIFAASLVVTAVVGVLTSINIKI